MNIIDKFTYHTWNIGFAETTIASVVSNPNPKINWVKHKYNNGFFADPFLLSYSDKEILVLVEDFPYNKDKGLISLLRIDRMTYELIEKKILLEHSFHQSYPFILRLEDKIVVLPEVSASGNLYAYDLVDGELKNQRVVLNEPMLDSTIIEYNGKWWLFGTKRGPESNKTLHIYYSDRPLSGYKEIAQKPAKIDAATARPGGHMFIKDSQLYRVVQKNDNFYGESMFLMRVTELTVSSFDEEMVHEITPDLGCFDKAFHTIDGLNSLCVVDGLHETVSPIRKITNKIIAKFNR